MEVVELSLYSPWAQFIIKCSHVLSVSTMFTGGPPGSRFGALTY